MPLLVVLGSADGDIGQDTIDATLLALAPAGRSAISFVDGATHAHDHGELPASLEERLRSAWTTLRENTRVRDTEAHPITLVLLKGDTALHDHDDTRILSALTGVAGGAPPILGLMRVAAEVRNRPAASESPHAPQERTPNGCPRFAAVVLTSTPGVPAGQDGADRVLRTAEFLAFLVVLDGRGPDVFQRVCFPSIDPTAIRVNRWSSRRVEVAGWRTARHGALDEVVARLPVPRERAVARAERVNAALREPALKEAERSATQILHLGTLFASLREHAPGPRTWPGFFGSGAWDPVLPHRDAATLHRALAQQLTDRLESTDIAAIEHSGRERTRRALDEAVAAEVDDVRVALLQSASSSWAETWRAIDGAAATLDGLADDLGRLASVTSTASGDPEGGTDNLTGFSAENPYDIARLWFGARALAWVDQQDTLLREAQSLPSRGGIAAEVSAVVVVGTMTALATWWILPVAAFTALCTVAAARLLWAWRMKSLAAWWDAWEGHRAAMEGDARHAGKLITQVVATRIRRMRVAVARAASLRLKATAIRLRTEAEGTRSIARARRRAIDTAAEPEAEPPPGLEYAELAPELSRGIAGPGEAARRAAQAFAGLLDAHGAGLPSLPVAEHETLIDAQLERADERFCADPRSAAERVRDARRRLTETISTPTAIPPIDIELLGRALSDAADTTSTASIRLSRDEAMIAHGVAIVARWAPVSVSTP